MAANFIKPIVDWVVKGLCGGDEKENVGTSRGNNRSSNVSFASFNNVVCCGKAENSRPSFHTPAQQNDGMKGGECQSHSEAPASQPKKGIAEGTSSDSTKNQEGEKREDPCSLLSSEKTPPSSESGSDSFHSTLDLFDDL